MCIKSLVISIVSLLAANAYSQSPLEQAFENACTTSDCADTSAEKRASLIEKYPDIAENTDRPENKNVLCPFLRMLERAGIFDPEKEKQSSLTVGIIKIGRVAREFACPVLGCGGVATAVSAGQLSQLATKPGSVNLEALHKAVGIAHDCGLTFALGGTEVDDAVRSRTLAELKKRSDNEGRLEFSDLEEVKLNICNEQGVELSAAGDVEVGLIYTFLGGNERGFVDYSDVELFLNAKLPKTLGAPGLVK